VLVGPTIHARVIASNVLGTSPVIATALFAPAFEEAAFLDQPLVYALLNFLLSIAFSKFNVEHGGVL
jgi:multicomponent Na+:H+ antiporter subunit F